MNICANISINLYIKFINEIYLLTLTQNTYNSTKKTTIFKAIKLLSLSLGLAYFRETI